MSLSDELSNSMENGICELSLNFSLYNFHSLCTNALRKGRDLFFLSSIYCVAWEETPSAKFKLMDTNLYIVLLRFITITVHTPLDKSVCVSICATAFAKGIKPPVLSPAISKL